jgi:Family of unknown function (DUF6084)
MLDLNFRVAGAEAAGNALTPLLVFKLAIEAAGNDNTPIQSILLRCQINLEPGRRRYAASEQGRLLDLFGEPLRWVQTLRPLLWTQLSVVVPVFTRCTVVDLPVSCSYDFHVAATKYLDGLDEGEVPLSLLFSGTIFYESACNGLQVAHIPWAKSAEFRLPVRTWKQLMERYYPNNVWLCLRKDVFDRLSEYKSQRCLPTWEQALDSLLAEGVTP